MRISQTATALPIMIALALAAVAPILFLPQRAEALSCMRSDLKFSYHQWQRAPGQFIILRGKLIAPEKLPEIPNPIERQNNPKPLEIVKYRFEGYQITPKENQPFSAEINVQPKCLGPWCGGYPHPTGQVLFATEHKDGSYWLQPGPCPGALFTGNIAELEQTARNCMNGVACTPPSRNPEPVPSPSIKLKIQ